MISSKDKAEMLKASIHQLYTNEGRSKSYISRLLGINRKTLGIKIREWKFEDPKPMHHLAPSSQKFLNRNRNLIKSRLDRDVSVADIAAELKIRSDSLRKTFINSDSVLRKAYEDYLQRKKDTHEQKINFMVEKSSRECSEDLEGEIWKPILGYEGYDVSNKGRVRHVVKRYGKYYVLKQTPNKNNGRMYVCLQTKKGRKNLNVARLVAHAFVSGYSKENSTVNHEDGNVVNNESWNLKWTSQGKNNEHAYRVLNRNKVNFKRYGFDKILYRGKYEFKTVAAFAKFIGKSETQARRYLDFPDKHEIKLVKNCND